MGVTATAYTLLGVVCKLISVVLNVLIWDKHATPTGLCMLMLCMSCSAFYQQAPLRQEPTPSKEEEEEDELKVMTSPAQIIGAPAGYNAERNASGNPNECS